MAQRVGVSASLISQIETGKVQPSVATLMAVASELDLSIDQLLSAEDGARSGSDVLDGADTDPADGASSSDRDGTGPPVRSDGENQGRPDVLQHHVGRERIELSSGVIWERLTANPDREVDFMFVTYPPGAASAERDQLLTHAGKEYWYVVSGRLRVQVVFDVYDAGPNDSFSFECTLPHLFRNDGDEPVRAVVMIVHNARTNGP